MSDQDTTASADAPAPAEEGHITALTAAPPTHPGQRRRDAFRREDEPPAPSFSYSVGLDHWPPRRNRRS